MLKKLLKYDLRSVIPFLCIFYVLALVCAGLSRLFLLFDHVMIWNIIGQIFSGAAVSMMFSIFINTAMRSWVLFRQNLYGDPSYLTHTLPVRKTAIYLSKALTGLIGMALSFGVIGVTLVIQYYGTPFWKQIYAMAKMFSQGYPVLVMGLLLGILFLQMINVLQCGFAGLLLGHKRNQRKIVWSVLAGLGVYAVGQILMLAVIGVIALFSQDFMNLFTTAQMVCVEDVWSFLTVSGILEIGLIAGCYFFNVKLFNRGVNVD